tara:strand:- start:2101 stop:3747 length:1647 start_codon:yes stop_codon:yes gene_type:complete
MHELIKIIVSKRVLFIKILAASLLVNILALATPIYVIQVLQRYVAYGVTSTLITLMVGIFFVVIFEFFFRNIRHRMAREYEMNNVILANNVLNKFVMIKSHIFETSSKFRNDIINKHLVNIQNIFTGTTIIALIDVPFSFIFLLALFLIHFQLGLICLLFLAIPFLINAIYKKRIHTLSMQNTIINTNLYRIYDNVITRNLTIKYFKLLKSITNSWNLIANSLASNKENFESEKNVLNSFAYGTGALMTIFIIGWGATLAVDGQISVGALIGANILAARALAPINRYVQIQDGLSMASQSSKEIENYFKISSELSTGSEIPNLKGNFKLIDLQFQYPSTKNPLFESLNHEIIPGQVVSISGYNGSGKSTLIKVLSGVLELSRGSILLDETHINQLSVQWYRDNLIYSPQEPKFVDGTLRENIFGSNNIDNTILLNILKKTDLFDYVNNHEQGINMILENRGENLPIGIRKRISLARGIANDGLLVCLDEPTEGLDKKGRDAVLNMVKEFKKKNKTVVIATNEQSIIDISDSLIDLSSKPRPVVLKTKK